MVFDRNKYKCMYRLRLLPLLLMISIGTASAQSPALIPYPADVRMHKGSFQLNTQTVVVPDAAARSISDSNQVIWNEIRKSSGMLLRESATPTSRNVIRVKKKSMPTGSYELDVRQDAVDIYVADASGLHHAGQTMLQLLSVTGGSVTIPSMHISDTPAFPYRGFMLDVARHYLPVDFIRSMIDRMALLKMNRLHLHLTDDQGWRMEIKKYPLLTSVGGWRNGTLIGRYPGKGSDNTPHGGYYTQQELRDLVAYARERFIDIIPEIDLPGHSSAAIAAYPALSCFPDSSTEVISSMMADKTLTELKQGRKKIVQETWGVFNDVLSPTEYTFSFINDVLKEVMDVFPSTYIHIGGDECPKEYWKRSAFCQQLIREKALKDEHGLQSYFIRRLEAMVEQRGRRIIGWDEILEGGLAPNATVMSWRGIDGGIESARMGHDVIMSPVDFCYLNLYQSEDPSDSIAWGGMLSLKKVYGFQPVPTQLKVGERLYIKGVQANLWTEYIGTPALAEFMLFPRLLAIAELGWRSEKTGFDHFTDRVSAWFPKMKSMGINHSRHLYELEMEGRRKPGGSSVELSIRGASPAAKLSYRVNNGPVIPYRVPFDVSTSCRIMAMAEVDGVVTDRKSTDFRFSLAAGRNIRMNVPPSPPYDKSAGLASVNGILGSDQRFTDPEWSGWNGKDMDAVIDFGRMENASSVSIRFFHGPNSWVYLPVSIELSSSMDGSAFTPLHSDTMPAGHDIGVYEKVLRFPSANMRYLKIVAKNRGLIPAGANGAGQPAWLFVDEISVD